MAKLEPNPKLETTARALKNLDFYNDEFNLPEDDSFYQSLHDKIMASVEKTEVKPVPFFYRHKDLLKRHWRSSLFASFLILMSFVAINEVNGVSQFLLFENHAVVSAKNEDQILALITNSPELMAQTVLSHKTNSDLLMDSALLSDEQLTKEEFDSL